MHGAMQNRWVGPLPVSEWESHDFPSPLKGAKQVRETGGLVNGRPNIGHTVVGAYVRLDSSLSTAACSSEQSLPLGWSMMSGDAWNDVLALNVTSFVDDDPFNFSDGNAASHELRIGLASRAYHALLHGHRVFVLACVRTPTTFRFLRFDRSGATYTDAFSATHDNALLHQFTMWIHYAPHDKIGFDTSVTLLPSGSPDGRRARDICMSSPLGDVLTEHASLCLIQIYDDRTRTFHRIVARRPEDIEQGYPGRATRAYPVVDLDEGCLVFVKDTWRVFRAGVPSETDTYRRLGKEGVRFLPDFYFGGDVPSHSQSSDNPLSTVQSTQCTYDLALRLKGAETTIQSHIHHRLLMKKIGRRLSTFKSSWELCNAIMCALQAHTDAFDIAHILHRNISDDNILIGEDGTGILIGWSHCIHDDRHDLLRTGTPIFMAIPLLTRGQAVGIHCRRYDLESFLYVLVYSVLRFSPAFQADAEEMYWSFIEFFGDPECVAKTLFLLNTGRFDERRLAIRMPDCDPLLRLLCEFRALFTYVYYPCPEERDSRDPRIQEQQKARRQRMRDAADALNNSSEPVLQVMRRWVERKDLWPENDAAQDKFGPEFRAKYRGKVPYRDYTVVGGDSNWSSKPWRSGTRRYLAMDRNGRIVW
ncbi:hypothetical protein K466DRAFT_512104 [Polyporus arcularius HHB13444]|uniref:Fungal-type protein kinase domain-containing protein n=1 Tax=Polyporus arcularius HHB13444 TaxID=1314778 RepID=A0A5C3PWJ8_9APHY|nr:hypothetical protein K466DRAFT_512104 [Polyporus arcularius HHB13444]